MSIKEALIGVFSDDPINWLKWGIVFAILIGGYIIAIPLYLVDNSAYAICYVTHDWGGAAKTLQRATKNELTIINLGERRDGKRMNYYKQF